MRDHPPDNVLVCDIPPLDRDKKGPLKMTLVSATRPIALEVRPKSPQEKASNLMDRITQYLSDESGASAAEYALILALVAAIIIGGMTILGNNINSTVSKVAGHITAT